MAELALSTQVQYPLHARSQPANLASQHNS